MRRTVPKEIEEEVLILARRRCCVCFGLDRDTQMKQGQIVHLDHDAANNELDNLAFLCLPHHDQYDSKTSQSKGLTFNEVRRFRRELHDAIESAWRQPVTFGDVTVRDPSDISGHYVWERSNAVAEVDVKYVSPSRVHVTGIALWGTRNKYGPNIGQLDFEAAVEAGRVLYNDGEYHLELDFGKDSLTATERYSIGYFGMNVTFEGVYTRTN